jgi:quinol monooxygenase YgiN
MIVQVAWYRACPGRAGEVVEAMAEAIRRAREEPGCRAYLFHQGVDDEEEFVLYEQYVDEAALEAHLATSHFRDVVQGRVNPLLAAREWKTYRLVEP